MKKKALILICGLLFGATIHTFPQNMIRVHASDMNTYETSDTVTEDAKDEIAFMVANGTFDSEALTSSQIAAIEDIYNGDPQAIRELERQSDANKDSDDTASLSSVNTGLYKHDSQFNGYTVLNGIDISRWQGDIDWNKVKASGIDFAIIRVALRTTADGHLEADALYRENLAGAIRAGLDVGVYIYSQAITTAEARAEADYTINLIRGYDINLPIVMDFEYYGVRSGRLGRANLSRIQATNICNAFCEEVERNNYTAMVYANKNLLTEDVYANAIAQNYQIWLAQYASWDPVTKDIHSSYSGTYSYWQYTSSGSVSGISGNVDMNFRYIKKPSAVVGLHQTSSGKNSVSMKWNKVPYAYGYQIYRRDEGSSTYHLVQTNVGTKNTTFTDSGLKKKSLYSYAVRAYYRIKKGNYYGGYSNIFYYTANKINISSISIDKRTTDSITLSFTAAKWASGYKITRYDLSAGSHKVIADVAGGKKTTTFTDTGLKHGTKYAYAVQAYYKEGGRCIEFETSSMKKTSTKPGKVTGVTASSSASTVTLTWDVQPAASGYVIYTLNSSGKWVQKKVVQGGSIHTYTIRKLRQNTTYQYCISAYYKGKKGRSYTEKSDKISVSTLISSVSGLSLKRTKNGELTLSWKSVKQADSYLIYVKKNKAGAKWIRLDQIPSDETSWSTIWSTVELKKKTAYVFMVKARSSAKGHTCTSKGACIEGSLH